MANKFISKVHHVRRGGFAESELDYCAAARKALERVPHLSHMCECEPPRVAVKIGTQIRDHLCREVQSDVIGSAIYNYEEPKDAPTTEFGDDSDDDTT